jgi:hypothetical protein
LRIRRAWRTIVGHQDVAAADVFVHHLVVVDTVQLIEASWIW